MPYAYVDGSYNIATKQFGYGVVFFTGVTDENGEPEYFTLSKAFSEPELAEMRNVAGEIMGSAQAMKSARARGFKELTIYHDYEGIAKWCTGEWKAKKTWTKKYKTFYEEISKDLSVTFKKVEAHSGNKFNDMADKLAKEAVGNK
ncbi:MAG: reverse transcriptase-like protein [Lachnospiraceae bacterium]|nr:reverse transcriptase-like protein [Lachnospiraceae bacterium]